LSPASDVTRIEFVVRLFVDIFEHEEMLMALARRIMRVTIFTGFFIVLHG
jgi:hypothetical protein